MIDNTKDSRFSQKQLVIIYTIISLLTLLVVWELVARFTKASMFLPAASTVLGAFFKSFVEPVGKYTMLAHIGISLYRVAVAFLLATVAGIALGIGMGYSKLLEAMLKPIFEFIRPIPPLAWVPLVLAWFGVSSLATAMGLPRSELYYYLNNLKISMLFIIFIGALFPILTSAVHGVQTVNRTLVDSARVLGASERDIFTKILLPAAAPSIVNGLRIGLGVAWMCLVSAEMLPGSLSGVGYLITHAYTVGRTDVVIAGMISISVVGALLDMAFQWIERRKYAWKQFSR